MRSSTIISLATITSGILTVACLVQGVPIKAALISAGLTASLAAISLTLFARGD